MPEAPAATTVHRHHHDRPTDETIKETFESVIIAFILAFVFRAFIVEAFVIPTGSMAPTLMGQHVHITCQECGYHFDVGVDELSGIPGARPGVCPMCRFPNHLDRGMVTSAGDRILVHKYIYNIVEPTRWDVVVFKNPQETNGRKGGPTYTHGPDDNFIKRLVGLPGEDLWIVEGNVYVKPASAPDSDWKIARKSDARQGERVQRAVWQPLYHSAFVPLDDGKPADPGKLPLGDIVRTDDYAWRLPWRADDPTAPGSNPSAWQFTDSAGHAARSYRHASAGPGRVRFDFSTNTIGNGRMTWYPYNEFSDDPLFIPEPMEDLRIAADFQPETAGLSVTLQTTARLDDPSLSATPLPLRGRIDPAGNAYLESVNPDGSVRSLGQASCGPFIPGQARNVELWFVDQEAMLWVDGRRLIDKKFDLPIDTILKRPPLTRRPDVAIEVAGSPVTLHDVQLDRDLYYTSAPVGGGSPDPGLGALRKHAFLDGTVQSTGHYLTLLPDQFFCMGDNSPRSSDGRAWPTVNDWVQKQIGGNITIQPGVVPRKLMMGRAFFVYFPAMYSWDSKRNAIFPNFGAVRFIH